MKVLNNIIKDNYIMNEITKKLDEKLLFNAQVFFNYINSKKEDDCYFIRYSVADRGFIRVNEENIIIEIKIYENCETSKIYKPYINHSLKKFLGYKFNI